jgi:hypothetical protein
MNMKRLIITVLTVGLTAGAVSAQSDSSHSSRTTTLSSTGNYKAKKSKKTIKTPSVALNHTKIYSWEDGQAATPTGHEAAPTNGGYQSLKRKPAAVKQREEY